MLRLIARHWRGELPPLTSFLGIGLLAVPLSIAALRIVWLAADSLEGSLATAARTQLAWFVGCLVILAWGGIGIWRSASSQSRPRKWQLRALLVSFGIALLPLGIATGKTSTELVQIALNRDPLGTMANITVEGEHIYLEGVLAQGTGDRFDEVLQEHPKIRTVELTSTGGRIAEAAQIAKAIKRRKLDTFVWDHCLSACTDVLLAGRQRLASTHASIGFHRVTMAGFNSLDEKLASSSTREEYVAAGLDENFIEKALATPSSGMWYPTPSELKTAGFLTDVVTTDEEAD